MLHDFVSVIIPVYNNFESLKVCLEALENQSYPKDSYEVIVVDNNSEKRIENDSISQFGNVRLEFEEKRGSYAARNKGLSIASGEILAFTDSDCVPDTDWIKNGVNAVLNNENCGLVGGGVFQYFKDPENPTITELWNYYFELQQKKCVQEWNFALTANLFTTMKIFKDVGYFDDNLFSGGDVDWGNRVFRRGYKLKYAKNAYVKHRARYSLKELYSSQIRIVGGLNYLSTKNQVHGIKSIKKILIDVIPPIISIPKLLRKEEIKALQPRTRKLKIALAFIMVRYIRLFERIRLFFGGKPRNI